MFGGKVGLPELILLAVISAPFALVLFVRLLRNLPELRPSSKLVLNDASLARICRHCSSAVAAGTRFCPNCGIES
jgi:hypothetical protein